MKIVVNLVFVSALFFFLSCEQKETLKSVADQSSHSLQASRNRGHTNWSSHFGALRKWYENSDEDYGCNNDEGSCLDDVVITGLDRMFSAIASQKAGAIKEAFAVNYVFLSKVLGNRVVDAVLKGELTVRVKGKSLEETMYLLFHDQADKIVLVAPFKK